MLHPLLFLPAFAPPTLGIRRVIGMFKSKKCGGSRHQFRFLKGFATNSQLKVIMQSKCMQPKYRCNVHMSQSAPTLECMVML